MRTRRLKGQYFLTSKVSLLILILVLTTVHQIQPVKAQPSPEVYRNELILALQLENTRLDSDILGYQEGDRIYLSLTELTGALQFPITVDGNAGLAGGWFIQEEREFSLNTANRQVISGDRTFDLNPESYFTESGDIFVDTNALEQWFPLRFKANLQQLLLSIQTLETLPIEEQLGRSSRTIRPAFTTREPELPLKSSDYELLGHRGTDARFSLASTRLDDDAETKRRFTGSILSRGDLAWMTSTIFASGTDDEINNARLTLERSRFDGPFGLNHVEAGDILNTVGSGNRGIGIRGGTANYSVDNRYSDESIDIDGDVLPDWQVEIYRNGVLIDFQEVGSDGRYAFTDVPLIFGENTFELVFYGPFGETRREELTQFVGPGVLGAGSVAYELSATQAGRSVFDVSTPSTGGADKDSAIYNADFNLGITRNISAGLSGRSYEQDETRLLDYTSNLNLTTSLFQLRTSYAVRERNQNQISGGLATRIGAVGLNAQYVEFTDEGLEPQYLDPNPRLWTASLSADVGLQKLPFTAATSFSKREFQETATGVVSSTYALSDVSRISPTISYSWIDDRENGGDLAQFTTANLSASTISYPWVLRGDITSDLYPEAEMVRAAGSGNLRIGDNMSFDINIERNFLIDVTRYRVGYSWDFPYFRISPEISYGSDERFVGLVSISTNFATRPETATPMFDRLSMANSGGVLARAFLDDNGDGRLNQGERPLTDVEFRAIQSFKKSESNERGLAYIDRLPAYRQTDVVMNTATLSDAELTPTSEGNSVMPRPGHWQTLDFPVVITSVLEGTVMEVRPNGQKQPLSRALVELRSQSGELARAQRTAYDGVFIFDRVPPGVYELRLSEELTARLIQSPDTLIVDSKTDTLSNLRFEVKEEKVSETLAPGIRFVPENETDTLIESEPLPPITPATEPSPTAPAPTEVPEPVAPVAAGNWLVQLGAYSSMENARRAWSQIQSKTTLLDSMNPNMATSGRLTRIYAGQATSEQRARALCASLKAEDIDCLVKERR